MKLLLDISVLTQQCWHSMASDNYEAKPDSSEIEEFSRNIYSMILGYVTRFQPDELIFATDGARYWRYAAYDKYYAENTDIYQGLVEVGTEETPAKEIQYYLTYDLKSYHVKYSEEFHKYFVNKLDKAKKVIMEGHLKDGTYKRTSINNVPTDFKELIPTYKGNRKGLPWKYTTDKAVFKKYCGNITKQLAKTFKAKYINIEAAEADDIAQAYHDMYPADDMVMVTTDGDWTQLLRKGMFLHFYNPKTRQWVETTMEQANKELAMKIMCGDAGDYIGAISLKGAKATLPVPKKGAKKLNKTELLYTEHGKGIYKWLGENADPASLKRNYQMIYLENCPKKLKREIKDTITNAKVFEGESYDHKNYGLDAKEVMLVENEAATLRREDLDEGVGYYD